MGSEAAPCWACSPGAGADLGHAHPGALAGGEGEELSVLEGRRPGSGCGHLSAAESRTRASLTARD